MTDVLSPGRLEVGWEGFGSCGQLEVGEMAPQLLVDGVSAHRRPRFCWSMWVW